MTILVHLKSAIVFSVSCKHWFHFFNFFILQVQSMNMSGRWHPCQKVVKLELWWEKIQTHFSCQRYVIIIKFVFLNSCQHILHCITFRICIQFPPPLPPWWEINGLPPFNSFGIRHSSMCMTSQQIDKYNTKITPWLSSW